jgi:hypothetical protein
MWILAALSPEDGNDRPKTVKLRAVFSEHGLIPAASIDRSDIVAKDSRQQDRLVKSLGMRPAVQQSEPIRRLRKHGVVAQADVFGRIAARIEPSQDVRESRVPCLAQVDLDE